jgi:hypothetical protein
VHQVRLLLVKDELGLPLFDAEELIDIPMHFISNPFTRPQAHHNQLRVLSRE